jgi:hypothetical protein
MTHQHHSSSDGACLQCGWGGGGEFGGGGGIQLDGTDPEYENRKAMQV